MSSQSLPLRELCSRPSERSSAGLIEPISDGIDPRYSRANVLDGYLFRIELVIERGQTPRNPPQRNDEKSNNRQEIEPKHQESF